MRKSLRAFFPLRDAWLLPALCFGASLSLNAKTCTWVGGSGKWSDGANWSAQAIPASGDAVVLEPSEVAEIVNDMGAMTLESIEFRCGLTLVSDGALTLSGNGGRVVQNSASADVAVDAPIVLDGGSTNVIAISGTAKTLKFMRTISGEGAVWFSGNSSSGNIVKLLAANSYEGGTRYSYCSVSAGSSSAFGADGTCVWNSGGDGKLWLEVPGDWNYDFMICSSGSQQMWFNSPGTYNVNGRILGSAASGWFRPYAVETVVANFNGDVELPGYTLYQHPYSDSEIHFRKPIRVALIRNGAAFGYRGGYTHLDASGNDYGEMWLGFSCNVKCGAPFALDADVPLLWKEYLGGGGYLDLCGNDQSALALDTGTGTATAGRYVASTGGGATLFLRGAAADYSACCILDDAVSLVWDPSGDFAQELKDQAHLTTGELTVSNGTLRIGGSSTFKRLSAVTVADGATFDLATTEANALESLGELKIGDGGVFRVADSAATPFGTDRLTLELSETAKLVLPSGCDCSFAAIYVTEGGVRRQIPGGDQSGNISQIVGGGRIAVMETEVADDPATWTAGGGTDVSIDTAANWDDNRRHDLTSGGFLPTFASAGSSAVVDVPASFRGLVFGGASEAFALSGESPVGLCKSGITVESSSDGTREAVVSVPIDIRANQVWRVADGATLRVEAPMSSAFPYAVTNQGGGTVTLAASSPAFAGSFVHAGGTLEVSSPTNAFGGAGDVPVVVDEVKKDSGVCTRLYGTVIERPVIYYAWNNSNYLLAHDKSTNRFARSFTLPQTGMPFRPRLRNRSVVICEGGMSAANYFTPTGDDWGLCRWIFDNRPFTCERSFNVGQYVCAEFNATGNSIANNLSLDGAESSISFGADFAFDQPTLPLSIGSGARNGTIWLNGHSQRFGDFLIADGASGVAVDSTAPAALCINQVTDVTNSSVDFTGFAGISKSGAAMFAMDRALSSTGTVAVTEGTFAMTANSSWINCTNVSVSGTGVFLAASARPFSRKATVSVSEEGKIEIPAGVTVGCRTLYLGDPAVEMPPGRYSSKEGPEGYRAYFAGDGALVTRGTHLGTTVVIR